MANPTSPTRMSPAELRRRLLAPPPDTSSSPVIPDDLPAPPPSRARRDSSRYSGATQHAIDLDALIQEAATPSNPRITPLPESRLDASQFRAAEIPMAIPVPAARAGTDEMTQLRMQNAELTRIIEEMRPLIEEATAQEATTQNKEREYQDLLAEKDLSIEELQLRLKQVEEQLANVPPPKQPKTRDELEEWNDELEQEAAKLAQTRRQIEDDRKQLRDDEESLEKQMREMECSMARERAMMARQETELKRLSAEIQHELELLQRGDGTLREQLSKFQRRHQEVLARSLGSAPPTTATAVQPPMAEPIVTAPSQKDSGLLRRIFRGGK